jgi:hypothetical protein
MHAVASAAANAIPGRNPDFAPASVLESLRMIASPSKNALHPRERSGMVALSRLQCKKRHRTSCAPANNSGGSVLESRRQGGVYTVVHKTIC